MILLSLSNYSVDSIMVLRIFLFLSFKFEILESYWTDIKTTDEYLI